jgi:hypothetical protein
MTQYLCSFLLCLLSLLDTLEYSHVQRLIGLHRVVRAATFIVYLLGPLYYCSVFLPGNNVSCQGALTLAAVSTFASLAQVFDLVQLQRYQSDWIRSAGRIRMPLEFVMMLILSPLQFTYTIVAYFALWSGLQAMLVRI